MIHLYLTSRTTLFIHGNPVLGFGSIPIMRTPYMYVWTQPKNLVTRGRISYKMELNFIQRECYRHYFFLLHLFSVNCVKCQIKCPQMMNCTGLQIRLLQRMQWNEHVWTCCRHLKYDWPMNDKYTRMIYLNISQGQQVLYIIFPLTYNQLYTKNDCIQSGVSSLLKHSFIVKGNC